MFYEAVLALFAIFSHLETSQSRYVTKTTLPPPEADYFKEYNLQYETYLKEVVATLESDKAFVDRLRNATPEEIQSGKIAEALDFVGHGVRSKLNQIKLIEIERLRRVLEGHNNNDDFDKHLEHIDSGKEAFDKKDLERLIKKTSKDMDMLDAEKHQSYKEFEMEEELKFRRRLETMTEEQKEEAKRKRNEALKQHHAARMKHPASKGQLQDVWENVDNLPKEAFDMKTFFRLHDTNNDGFLDMLELEALFQKELDKAYDPKTQAVEREEELMRMRRHVMEEIDKNGDGLISLEEFLGEQQSPNFENESYWDPLDPTDAFSESELRSFERNWEKEHADSMRAEVTQTPTFEPIHIDSDMQMHGRVEDMEHRMPGQPVPQAPAYPTDNLHQAYPQANINNQQPPVMQQHNVHQQPPVVQHQQEMQYQQHHQQPGVQYQQQNVAYQQQQMPNAAYQGAPGQGVPQQQYVPPPPPHQGVPVQQQYQQQQQQNVPPAQGVPVQQYQQHNVPPPPPPPPQGGVPVQQNYQQHNVPPPQGAVPVQQNYQQQQHNMPAPQGVPQHQYEQHNVPPAAQANHQIPSVQQGQVPPVVG